MIRNAFDFFSRLARFRRLTLLPLVPNIFAALLHAAAAAAAAAAVIVVVVLTKPMLLTTACCLLMQAEHFLVNFTEDRGCFSNVRDRWTKWMGRHQELPLSMARLGCSSFYVGEGLKVEKPLEQAVGQEFAMAFLKVVWPEQFIGPC